MSMLKGAPIHMKSWPKVQLSQVGVGSDIA